MSFAADPIERIRPLRDRMLSQPFLLRTPDGTLPHEDSAGWMRQDHLFAEAAVPFIAGLVTRAPEEDRQGPAGFLPETGDAA